MKQPMKLTGVEISFADLSKLEPNTLAVVVSDKDGAVRTVSVKSYDAADTFPDNTVLSVTGAADSSTLSTPCGAPQCCLVYQGGKWIWVPC